MKGGCQVWCSTVNTTPHRLTATLQSPFSKLRLALFSGSSLQYEIELRAPASYSISVSPGKDEDVGDDNIVPQGEHERTSFNTLYGRHFIHWCQRYRFSRPIRSCLR